MTTIGGAAANPSQVMENLPSSLIGAMSAFSGKKPAKEVEPGYAMAFRFKVEITELGVTKDLGKWQSCTGLKVNFNPFPVKSGGNYLAPSYLPGEMTYPNVVLKRAVDASNSDAVQRWLREAATKWITGTDKESPGDAKINVYDSNEKIVLTWHLKKVRPASWSGPDLEANNSKVAIETLELVHEGFEVSAFLGRKQPPLDTATKEIFLAEHKNEKKKVTFTNAPPSMTVERNSDPAVVPSTEGNNITVGEKAGMTRLRMGGNIYIVPPKRGLLVDVVKQLIDWATGSETGEKDQNKKPIRKLPLLKLDWGEFKYWGELTQISVEYVRFQNDGIPTRAKVGFTLTETSEGNPPTNPSSGGIPGRSGHLLIHNENLPLIAQERYGTPSRWRDIAEANDIDDPLRVRPGDDLFLPAFSELTGR